MMRQKKNKYSILLTKTHRGDQAEFNIYILSREFPWRVNIETTRMLNMAGSTAVNYFRRQFMVKVVSNDFNGDNFETGCRVL